jgi:glycerol kinase
MNRIVGRFSVHCWLTFDVRDGRDYTALQEAAPMPQYILALDQGTTSSRAILVDQRGRFRAVAQKEFKQHYPKPGWVEHDPMEIIASQFAVARQAMRKVKARPKDIKAIGITNQRETTVIWDRKTGKPIHNAIVWQDRRTADLCQRLKAEGRERSIRERTGLVLDAYFSGSKIRWLMENVRGAAERAAKGELAFGTIDSWLIWNLTSGRVHATDASNASRTLLCDIHSGQWDDELLSVLKAPRSLCPEIRGSSEVIAETSARGFEGIPIAGIAGDQQAALFGQMCVKPGMAKCTYGTGAFILLNTGSNDTISPHQLLTTIAWKTGEQIEYATEGSVFIAGAVTQWLRDGLGIIKKSADIEKLARKVKDNGDVYLVPAFVGLGAPHWDQYARGCIVGLTRGSSAAHIARAALESIAFQVADVLDTMRLDSGMNLSELRVDGGAAVNDLLMQFQADLLGIPVVRPTITETTALGAAYLAGLAVGFWKSHDDIASKWKVDKRYEPKMKPDQVRALRKKWTMALDRARDWARE